VEEAVRFQSCIALLWCRTPLLDIIASNALGEKVVKGRRGKSFRMGVGRDAVREKVVRIPRTEKLEMTKALIHFLGQ